MASVMVVDDEPRIRTYLNRSLSALGHRVFEAEDDQAALDELERDVDLILLDVVAKPFSAAELAARVRRHLRHEAPASSNEQRFLVVGGVQLNLDRRRAITADGSLSLTEREFTLLAHLMRRDDRVCSREGSA